MTLTQSDVTSLLDAIRAGGDIDLIRKGAELVLPALIEAEVTEAIGAPATSAAPPAPISATSETARSHQGRRRGPQDAQAATRVVLLLDLERRRGIDPALFAVVIEAYVHGVSTRK